MHGYARVKASTHFEHTGTYTKRTEQEVKKGKEREKNKKREEKKRKEKEKKKKRLHALTSQTQPRVSAAQEPQTQPRQNPSFGTGGQIQELAVERRVRRATTVRTCPAHT
jgi:hypothetical protein